MAYQNERESLLNKVWEVAEASGRPQLFKYLQSDHRTDGSYGPLRDIDPFTVLGTFNRGIRHEARAQIARVLGEAVGVEGPYPESFPGMPVLNNLNSWFIPHEDERGARDVDVLWELCGPPASMRARQLRRRASGLVAAFDACARGGTRS